MGKRNHSRLRIAEVKMHKRMTTLRLTPQRARRPNAAERRETNGPLGGPMGTALIWEQ